MVFIQEILPFCCKQVNPNNISAEHSSIDPNLKKILRQLNYLSEQETNDNENLRNCKNIDVSYFSNLDVKPKLKCLSLFRLNRTSL